MMQRRTVLQTVLGVLAWRPFGRLAAQQHAFGDGHLPQLVALAAAVLPREIGDEGQGRAVDQFLRWVRDYRPEAEADSGYGVTRLRRTPPSPALKYPEQLDDLDRRAGGAFAAASIAERQRLVADAVGAANVTDLPGRPNGAHIATDLMSHYLNSPAANDLAYGRLIGRDACRELQGSGDRPATVSRSVAVR